MKTSPILHLLSCNLVHIERSSSKLSFTLSAATVKCEEIFFKGQGTFTFFLIGMYQSVIMLHNAFVLVEWQRKKYLLKKLKKTFRLITKNGLPNTMLSPDFPPSMQIFGNFLLKFRKLLWKSSDASTTQFLPGKCHIKIAYQRWDCSPTNIFLKSLYILEKCCVLLCLRINFAW